MGDMEDGGWVSRVEWQSSLLHADIQNHYVCLEPGYVSEFKTLKPGEEFIGHQALVAEW